MDRFVSSLKYKYAQTLTIAKEYDRCNEVMEHVNDYVPILKVLPAEEDEASSAQNLNTMIKEIATDCDILDTEISSTGFCINEMLNDYIKQLELFKTELNEHKALKEDVNLLCSAYSDFDNVLPLDISSSNFSYNHNLYTAKVNSTTEIPLTIVSIAGNGYEGNDYVLTDINTFAKDIFDTSSRANLLSGLQTDFYEYSRLSCNSGEPYIFGQVNTDSIPAKCTITLSASDYINHLYIGSDQKYLILSSVYTSEDGINFTKLDSFANIEFNNPDKKYTASNQNYIYNSGLITFPQSKYLRLSFESNIYTDEQIAFINKTVSSDNQNIVNNICLLNNTHRYVIRLNSLRAYKNNYDAITTYTTDNLITGSPISAIALYTEQHIPEYILSKYPNENFIQYKLIINDTEYDIAPINSSANSTKIIKVIDFSSNQSYVQSITESIKSAVLKIIIKSADNEYTPYISKIKILTGNNTTII